MDRAGASGMFPVPVWGSGRAGLAGTSSTIPGLEGLWDSCLPLPIFQGLGGIFGNFASLPLCLGSVQVCRSSHEPPLASSLRAAGPCSVISVRYLCVLSPIECETGASGPHPTEAPHRPLSLCLLLDKLGILFLYIYFKESSEMDSVLSPSLGVSWGFAEPFPGRFPG